MQNHTEVLLVWPPFGPINSPPIGLSILKSCLEKRNIQANIRYSNIAFSKHVPIDSYHKLANGYPTPHDLVGEWIFAERDAAWDDQFCSQVLSGDSFAHRLARPLPPTFDADVRVMASQSWDFARMEARAILNMNPRIVGFSSVFQQSMASLSIAKAIKSFKPDVLIVFGGANCEGKMGASLLETFDQIDVVISGEGEAIFSDLCFNYLRKGVITAAPNVFSRTGLEAIQGDRKSEVMDEVPIPDYSDFTALVPGLGIPLRELEIPFETSRGCWWGEKQHCIFCGLNGDTMHYRKKSSPRILVEIDTIGALFPESKLVAVDNIVHMDTVRVLKERSNKNSIFFESKANLKKSDFIDLLEANVTEIQIGVESLSTPCLKVMEKGITGIRNIQTLKWATEFGLHVHWNILTAVPDIPDLEYDYQARIMESIVHLQPPASVAPIRIDRFSPLFQRAINITPYPAYKYVFRTSQKALHDLAYFFIEENRADGRYSTGSQTLSEAVTHWKNRWQSALLFKATGVDRSFIVDTRKKNDEKIHILNNIQDKILYETDSIISIEKLFSKFTGVSAIEMEDYVTQLEELGLIFSEDNNILSLVPMNSAFYPGRGVVMDDRRNQS